MIDPHRNAPPMAAVKTVVASGLKLCEPLICVGLKAVLQIPEGAVDAGIKWVKQRFTDHSLVLTNAVSTAHDRAWQAVALALAPDSFFSHVTNLFRDGDLKAVQKQIREFIAAADTGFEHTSAHLRANACKELERLKKDGRLATEGVELTSLDLTRFASAAKVADDAHRAIHHIAADLTADAPHLAQVLTLTPPGGGTPLLAAAFAYFLRREIATNAELARELTHDQLHLLTLKQQAGFANLELSLDSKWGELFETLGGWFATADADLADIKAKLEQLLEQHQVSKKAESPLRVSVTSEAELQRLKKLRDRLRQQPPELVDAELQTLLGDGLAAAGQYADAATAHAAAADTAKEESDRSAEEDAAYKQFKDACELKQWDAALAALNRAVALDEKRFRPVPKHYVIEAVLGAGSFGVVLKCRNTISFDDDGNELVLAVKTFREADLERPLKKVFGEAHTLKTLTHENVIRIHDHGYADADGQTRPFVAMEFVAGATLEDHLSRHGKLTVADFTAIFRQIAAALHAAHTGRRQIIHRDLKPANVMVWRDRDEWRVKVIDFGLAVRGAVRTASLSVPHSLRATREKAVTGTIKYAAPEQLGEKPYPVGPWSDVFAFGKTAMEALLGTVQPTPRHWKQLPEVLADLLARCVDEEYDAKTPDDGRFHGFAPVLAALAAAPPPAGFAPLTPATSPTRGEVGVAGASPSATEADKSKPTSPLVGEVGTRSIPGGGASEPPAAKNPATHTSPLAGEVGTRSVPGGGAVVPLVPLIGAEPKLVVSVAKPVRKAGDLLTLDLPGGLKMAFAWCPPGTFMMGSPASEKEREDEEQQHEVRLTKGFYAGVHPVTQAEWKAVMNTDPSHTKGANLPVEQVSWEGAQAFCKKVRELSGKAVRLPTEAEWEYACRGGTTTPFYWGGELNGTQANVDGNQPYGIKTKGPWLEKTTPVANFAKKFPHPWGLTDVHGNVWEWCIDLYNLGFYARSPKEDPEGRDSQQKLRVLRGGSWYNNASRCRAARRNWDWPSARDFNYGFRAVFCLD